MFRTDIEEAIGISALRMEGYRYMEIVRFIGLLGREKCDGCRGLQPTMVAIDHSFPDSTLPTARCPFKVRIASARIPAWKRNPQTNTT
jgi:hypothetical protein